jgi:hypothetical protein
VVAYRQSNPDKLNSVLWLASALPAANALQAGPFVTAQTYQFTADIAAVGHHGRGYKRCLVVFDTSDGTPRVVYKRDLTDLGWALGKDVRNSLAVAK